jgi:type VI protein secretion system component VasF
MRFTHDTGFRRLLSLHWARPAAALAVCLTLAGWAQQPSPDKSGFPVANSSVAAKNALPATAAGDAAKGQAGDSKQQVADDAARLLQLATELKAEVDKTNKDTLSLKVIRKAETIEKLAKGVKQQLKQSGGAS